MTTPAAPIYAWCFDHGCMHTFQGLEDAWCTAAWVAFPADTFEQALDLKKAAYRDARYLADLPLLQQYDVVEMRVGRMFTP